ncbi:MAG: hypothetical protein HGA65_07775 [Oscillochloris sp.]|nr:hypothetical protein [Oscillochloris sp.]
MDGQQTSQRRGLMAWSTRDLMVLVAIALVFGLLLTGLTFFIRSRPPS